MNVKQACEVLTEVERDIDVNTVHSFGKSLWPIIRINLWFILTSEPRGVLGKTLSLCNFILASISSIVIRPSKNLESEDTSSILFIADDLRYSENICGKKYNRILDPIIESIPKDISVTKLDLGRSNSESNYIRARVKEAIKPTFFHHAKSILIAIHTSGDLLRIARRAKISRLHLFVVMLKNMTTILANEDFFSTYLANVNPKLIVLCCYYNAENLGAISAAHRLGIKSVDVQHGKQGKYQGAYSHWSVIPENGYDFLPDVFWVWGQDSLENIMKFSRHRQTHKCQVGGYPWLHKFVELRHCSRIPLWLDCRLKNKKVILISLQAKRSELEEVLPSFISDSIRVSPLNCIWLLRCHPNHLYVKKEVLGKLKDVPGEKYVIDNLNDIALYDLLSLTDIHITAFSTVVYEAEYFSAKNIVFGEDAKILYKKEIESSRFSCIDNKEDLLRCIKKQLNAPSTSCNDELYIESDKNLTATTIKSIFSTSL